MQLSVIAAVAQLALAQGPHVAPAAAAPSSFHWDIPEPLEQVEVPGIVTSNGLPMKLAAIRSRWRSDQLLQFFATAFERAHLYIPPVKDQPQRSRHPQLTALDPGRMVAFTVILQQNDDGSTTVITGEAHLAERQSPKSYLAPLFPGAQQAAETHIEGMHSLTYKVAAPAKDVKAFYADQLPRLGFRALPNGRFQQQDRLLRVDAVPEGSVTRVVVLEGLPADLPLDPGGAK